MVYFVIASWDKEAILPLQPAAEASPFKKKSMKRKNFTSPATSRAREGGFSLIITLSLMILLALISVGLLSLSTVTLRSANHLEGQTEARANARLALMLAIGELQKQAGSDTRVTARADILDVSNPPVMGVWRSWEGEDHEQRGRSAGRPLAPDYEQEKDGRFLSWLVSDQTGQMPNTMRGGNKATLVGLNTVGAGAGRENLEIHLNPSPIGQGNQINGRYAWWVSGENQKARLPEPNEIPPETNGEWASQMKSHSVADPEVFRMNQVLEDPTLVPKTTSLAQSDFYSQGGDLPVSQEFFHDLSVNSMGLLTNVATGGWKKDLSLFSEDRRRETRDLPLFRISPEEESMGNLATRGSASAAGSIFYPWADYRGSGGVIPIYQHGPVASWNNMLDYLATYNEVNTTSTGRASITPRSERINGNTFNFLHRVRLLPVIARVQWVFSHSAAISTQRGARPGDLEARLLMTPVITMWNPYSVEMNFNRVPLNFVIRRPLPVAFRYNVNGVGGRTFNALTAGSSNHTPPMAQADRLNYVIRRGFSLKPGETIVFSPASQRAVPAGQAALEVRPGYRSGGGHFFSVVDARRRVVSGPPETLIQADARFDTIYSDRADGVGIYLDMRQADGAHLVYRMVYTPEVARAVYPEIAGETSTSLGQVLNNPLPFMTTLFGARMASRTHLSARGFVQSSPLVNYTAMGGKDRVESTIGRHYGGTDHPVNSPFDYSFRPLSGNDSLLPNGSNTDQRGFIVTGFDSAEGLSRCVIAEVPTRPLQSLAELQHWDLRYENPIPPFAFNLIGNSDANPLLPPNAVVNRADAGLPTNLQHDDSYCANHLLFDDWFLSSIAPDPNNFGSNGRSQKDVYLDMLRGDLPLPNEAYQAIPEDMASASSDSANASSLFDEHVASQNSWQTIASRLEVKGMFNVNSTSVTAWRALLRHARNQQVPYIRDSAGGWDVDLSAPTDYAVSRFSIAGDVEASGSGSSGQFPEAAEFAGYRQFNEEALDILAEEIVNQVRLRGPFLSLSEFVNRQLSSGDLALAGAIQTALNQLGRSGSSPYAVMESVISRPSVANPPGANNAEYQFPAAAVGVSTYGLPGWTRQADILRPLAPILTARDDTFTIRAYGDSQDRAGRIVATAVCEAVVQRTRDFVDPVDDANTSGMPTNPANQLFGRRMKLVSFRWLSEAEV